MASTAASLHEWLGHLVDAYEERVDTVERLMVRAVAELKRTGREQEDLLNRLAERLARSHSLRKRDFDRMVEGLKRRRRDREQELETALGDFRTEDERIIARLRQAMSSQSDAGTVRELGTTARELIHLQSERETRIGGLLRSFHMEQEELRAMLEKILERAPKLRIRDVRALVDGHLAWTEQRSEAHSILEDLETVRRVVEERWRPVVTQSGQQGHVARL